LVGAAEIQKEEKQSLLGRCNWCMDNCEQIKQVITYQWATCWSF